MGKPWKVEDPFQMEFVEKCLFPAGLTRRGVATRFGGKILRLREDAKWPGSPWEAADIQWDGSGGLQSISMFETCSDGIPAETLSPAEESRFSSLLQELTRQPWAAEFVEPVPSELPSLRCYDALIPVRMELRRVQERLAQKFYRTAEQVVWDLRLIAANCLFFNDADSDLARHARLLQQAVAQIAIPPREPVSLPPLEPVAEAQPAVLEAKTRVREAWRRVAEIPTELPRFWVEHGAELWVSGAESIAGNSAADRCCGATSRRRPMAACTLPSSSSPSTVSSPPRRRGRFIRRPGRRPASWRVR